MAQGDSAVDGGASVKARLSKHKKGEGLLMSFILIMHLCYLSFVIEHAFAIEKSLQVLFSTLGVSVRRSQPQPRGTSSAYSGEEFYH